MEKISTKNQEIKSSEVLDSGKYPVVSQSSNKIDGYSNDESKVIKNYPIILFGDHTRAVKYINYPFIPGADGTKLYKPKCFPKYLYYLMLYASLNIENKGYARHNALMKSFYVPYFADVEIQKYMSKQLDKLFVIIDELIYNKECVSKITKILKYKILNYYFNQDTSYKSYYENKFELGLILEYEQPTNYIVNSPDYNDEYQTPVLTAGKTFVLGYTNETNGIYHVKKGEKVIIFDDFTTSSHLVDFDFKVKSSAMKILKITNENLFDIDYIFYLLQTLKIDTANHKRYWIQKYAPLSFKIHTYDQQKEIVKSINNLYNLLDLFQ